MKRTDNSAKASKNLDLLISKVSENDILDIRALNCIRGGEGEGSGGEPIIIIPNPV